MNINPCPNPECRATCELLDATNGVSDFWKCQCTLICGYEGPCAYSESDAVRLHNLISPQPSAPAQPLTERELAPWPSYKFLFSVVERGDIEAMAEVNPGIASLLTHFKDGLSSHNELVAKLSASPSAQPQPGEAAREDGVLIDGPHGRLSSYEYAFQIYKNGCVGNPYWMIERGSPAQWWVGNNRAKEEWTTDSFWAMRIVSKEMATLEMEKLLQYCGVKGPLRVTDHLDVTSSAAPEPSVAAEASDPGRIDLLFLTDKGAVVTGTPARFSDLPDEKQHNCDEMGCQQMHVLKRFASFVDERTVAPGIVPGWVLVPVEPTEEITRVFNLCAKEKYPCAFLEMWEWALKAATPKGQP